MKAQKINEIQYIGLKNLSYQVYLLSRKMNSDEVLDFTKKEIEKYDNEEMKKIVYNTLLFPFDVELYNMIEAEGKLNDVTIQLVAEKFDISVDLVKQKLDEYIRYKFINLVGEGQIDYDTVSKLPNQLFTINSDQEKVSKSS